MTPKVSVLVPIYNVERYLSACLDSLRAQTFEDFEAILINDGSTDGSRQIIQRYLDMDPRFTVIDKPNSGYGASMNRGLAAARGAYVAILESDDIFEPTALETLHDAAQWEGADAVKANFWLYWSKPQERRVPFDLVDPEHAGETFCPSKDGEWLFYGKPSIWSALYRRSFLVDNGIDFLETPGASYQDTSFTFKVWALADKVTCIPNYVLSYRQDNEASSINSPGKVYCVCDEYAEIVRFLDERPELSERLMAVACRMKFDSYMWNAGRLTPELRKEFLSRARDELTEDLALGRLDLGKLGWYKRTDLMALLSDPERFLSSFDTYGSDDEMTMLRHYWQLGGVLAALQLAARFAARRIVV